MERIDLVIPTRNRRAKLERALASIPASASGVAIDVIVACDGDETTFRSFLGAGRDNIRIVYFAGHRGSVFVRNAVIRETHDAVIYFCDDMTFYPGAIATVVDEFRSRFPDDDGVVGFGQEGIRGTGNPAAVALVGKKFIDRYPNRDLFFPGYFLFACQEVLAAAEALGRFYHAREARTFHYHPAFNPKEIDQTHKDGRIFADRDKALREERQAAGLIWGLDRSRESGRDGAISPPVEV